jgi:hypothetical protein
LRAYLNAVPPYQASGYQADQSGDISLTGDVAMPVLFMRK